MAGEILKAPMDMLLPRDYVAPTKDAAQTEGSGKGSINKLGPGQVVNNAAQSKGSGTMAPSEWGGVSTSIPTSSAEAGTKVSADYSVDLVSGQNSCWQGGK